MKPTFISACQLFVFLSLAIAEQDQPPATEAAAGEAEAEVAEPAIDLGAEWLEGYYLNPTPNRFVPQMKAWAEDGTLKNQVAQPALIGFMSQLMRQNRDQILPWTEELNAELTPEDMVVYHTALVFSRTGQADELIKKALGDQWRSFERPSKILELTLNEPPTMNMLWGYFYATGSESAIRRIIHGFRYEDAPLAPEGAKIPEGYQPYYVELPELARSSLWYNMQKQPKVVEILEKFHQRDATLLEAEKRNVYDLLAFHNPEKYPPRKVEEKEEGEAEAAKEG